MSQQGVGWGWGVRRGWNQTILWVSLLKLLVAFCQCDSLPLLRVLKEILPLSSRLVCFQNSHRTVFMNQENNNIESKNFTKGVIWTIHWIWLVGHWKVLCYEWRPAPLTQNHNLIRSGLFHCPQWSAASCAHPLLCFLPHIWMQGNVPIVVQLQKCNLDPHQHPCQPRVGCTSSSSKLLATAQNVKRWDCMTVTHLVVVPWHNEKKMQNLTIFNLV